MFERLFAQRRFEDQLGQLLQQPALTGQLQAVTASHSTNIAISCSSVTAPAGPAASSRPEVISAVIGRLFLDRSISRSLYSLCAGSGRQPQPRRHADLAQRQVWTNQAYGIQIRAMTRDVESMRFWQLGIIALVFPGRPRETAALRSPEHTTDASFRRCAIMATTPSMGVSPTRRL